MDPNIARKIGEHFAQYPLRKYPKGQIIIFAGEDPEYIFHLVKGKVRQYDISYRGDEVVVNVFKPPAFFPMSFAINRSANHFFFKTEEETAIRIANIDSTLEFVKSNPDVMFDLLSRLYRGTDALLARIVHLMSGSAASRLLYEIIIECRRFSKQSKDGSYKLALTEGDLAARTGLSRETVSRTIRDIKDQKLLTINQSGITVNDLKAIEEKIGYEI
jgi:CRP/FNR family transcriptional regulator, cyclic AMP receptor protein